MRNILVMLMSVITSGSVEIEPKLSPALIVLPSFVLPSPSDSGLSVRNIEAFRLLFEITVQVLTSSFLLTRNCAMFDSFFCSKRRECASGML